MQHVTFAETWSEHRALKNQAVRKMKLFFPVAAWISGLLLAGSDGPMMPYLNGAGALLFLGASIWLGKILPGLDKTLDKKPSCGRRVPRVIASRRRKSSRPASEPVYPGYARQFGVI